MLFFGFCYFFCNMSDPDGSSSSDSDLRFAGGNPSTPSERGAVNGGKAPRKSRQSSGSNDIIKELRRMESALSASIQEVSRRVDRLEGAPPAKRKATEVRRGSDTLSPIGWAGREDDMASVPRPQWSDSDQDEHDERAEVGDGRSGTPSVIQLSEENAALVSSAFSTVLPSAERKRVRDSFPCPGLEETRCPRLDPLFKTASVNKDTKSIDSELARIQSLMHDPAAPLIDLLHSLDTISSEDAKATITAAIKLLGNASANMSRLRRKRVLRAVNPDIMDLAEEDIFKTSAPNLFGPGFEGKMKERAESVKLLTASKAPPSNRKFFRGGRPPVPPRGGGQTRRGGRQWFRSDKPGPRK